MNDLLPFLGLVFLLAFCTEALAGFGSAIIALALGSLLVPIHEVVPLVVALNVFLTGYMAIRYRGHVDLRFLLTRVFPFMGLGLLVGQQLLDLVTGSAGKQLFGGFVIAVSLRELWKLSAASKHVASPLGRFGQGAWLSAAGVLHGMYATGGPPLVYVLGRSTLPKTEFRSTIATIFFTLNTSLALLFIRNGRLNADNGALVAWLVPVVLLSIVIGEWGHHRVEERTFRRIVFSLLLAAGAMLVLNP